MNALVREFFLSTTFFPRLFKLLTFQKKKTCLYANLNFDDHQGVEELWCTLSSVKCDPITTPATAGHTSHNNISACATPIFSSAAADVLSQDNWSHLQEQRTSWSGSSLNYFHVNSLDKWNSRANVFFQTWETIFFFQLALMKRFLHLI